MKSVLENQNILVTGATGLVGGHLTEKLISLGAKVFCTVRSVRPDSYFYQKGLDKQVVSVICDITEQNRVMDVVSKYEIAYIFHVAAQPIVPTAYINPYETFNSNIMGTVNVLEAARLSPYIKGVVVASSDKAYGKECLAAVETNKLAGDHPYDVSKSCTDLITTTYHRTYSVPVAVSRFGNIFGPGDLNYNRIIPGIMKSLLMGEELQLRSDGTFVRDYVYVKDVVAGYIMLAEQMNTIKGEAFNFSTGYNFSVLDLIAKISKIIGKPVSYKIVSDHKNEIPFQSLNFEKAEKVLGWKATTSLDDAIKLTFDWYKNHFTSKV